MVEVWAGHPCNCCRRRGSHRNISLRSRLSSKRWVSFTNDSHGNCSSLLRCDRSLPSVHRNWSEPGSALGILLFIFHSNRSSEYWPLHCVFCRCRNIIPIPGPVAAILSRCTVSMDRNNGESTALSHRVNEKVGCEIGTRYKLLGQSEQTRMEQGDDNHRVL